jgi:hypothetical protein
MVEGHALGNRWQIALMVRVKLCGMTSSTSFNSIFILVLTTLGIRCNVIMYIFLPGIVDLYIRHQIHLAEMSDDLKEKSTVGISGYLYSNSTRGVLRKARVGIHIF